MSSETRKPVQSSGSRDAGQQKPVLPVASHVVGQQRPQLGQPLVDQPGPAVRLDQPPTEPLDADRAGLLDDRQHHLDHLPAGTRVVVQPLQHVGGIGAEVVLDVRFETRRVAACSAGLLDSARSRVVRLVVRRRILRSSSRSSGSGSGSPRSDGSAASSAGCSSSAARTPSTRSRPTASPTCRARLGRGVRPGHEVAHHPLGIRQPGRQPDPNHAGPAHDRRQHAHRRAVPVPRRRPRRPGGPVQQHRQRRHLAVARGGHGQIDLELRQPDLGRTRAAGGPQRGGDLLGVPVDGHLAAAPGAGTPYLACSR